MRLSILNNEVTSIHAAALILGAASLLSKFLGILRDRLLAGTFGAGRELDAYYAAFQVPDSMAVLFLLGAASAAILPIFQEFLAKDPKTAREVITALSVFFLLGAIVVGVIAFIFARPLIGIVAPGFSLEDRELAVTLTRIILLSPVLLGLSGIYSSVTQSFQRFWAYALAPIFYNIGIILGIVVFVPMWGVKGLAFGVVLGALMHFLIQASTAALLGFSPSFFRPTEEVLKGVRKIITLSFPRVLAVSLSHITLIVIVALGSTLAQGSIAILHFANNLYALPVGIFGTSYAVALFPRLTRAFGEKNPKIFFDELFLGIRTILFWIIPLAVIFIVLRAHIVRVALGTGEFSWEDTRLTAAALAALAVSMAAWSVVTLLIRGFYAINNTWTPFVINLCSSFISVTLAYLFTYLLYTSAEFREAMGALFRIGDLPRPEVVGLALGYALGQIVNGVLLYFALAREAGKSFSSSFSFPLASLYKITAAALFGGIVAYLVRVSFSETLPLITFARVLIQGVVVGIFGMAAYFGALYILKSEDLMVFSRALRRRIFGIKALPKEWDGNQRIPSDVD